MAENSSAHPVAELVSALAAHSQTANEPMFLLGPFCEDRGIQIRKSPSVPRFKAKLTKSNEAPSGFRILLPQRKIGPYERFCIAHELGHLFLSKYLDSWIADLNYWEIERACDEFARQLLVSSKYVAEMVDASRPKSAAAWLDVCRIVSDRAKVPWTQAAKRITAGTEQIAFFRIGWRSSEGELEARVASSTLENDRGRFHPINRNTKFGDFLEDAKMRRIERVSENLMVVGIEPSDGLLEDSLFTQFADRCTDASVELTPGPYVEARLALVGTNFQ